MASGTIKEQQSVIGLDYAHAVMQANVDHVSITAPAKAGYTFWYWVNAHSTGWLEGLFIEDPSSQTTNLWRNGGMMSQVINQGGDVYVLATYLKN